MNVQATEKAPPYNCQNCVFSCFKKSGWNRHIITAKHICLEKQEKQEKQEKIQFICDCGKTYADRSGLWRHSHKCVHKKKDLSGELEEIIKTEEPVEIKETDLIQILINENSDLKNLILELVKKESTTNKKDANKIVNLNFTIDDKHNIIGCV